MIGIVMMNGKDSGLRETNRAYADVYWANRARLRPELRLKVIWK